MTLSDFLVSFKDSENLKIAEVTKDYRYDSLDLKVSSYVFVCSRSELDRFFVLYEAEAKHGSVPFQLGEKGIVFFHSSVNVRTIKEDVFRVSFELGYGPTVTLMNPLPTGILFASERFGVDFSDGDNFWETTTEQACDLEWTLGSYLQVGFGYNVSCILSAGNYLPIQNIRYNVKSDVEKLDDLAGVQTVNIPSVFKPISTHTQLLEHLQGVVRHLSPVAEKPTHLVFSSGVPLLHYPDVPAGVANITHWYDFLKFWSNEVVQAERARRQRVMDRVIGVVDVPDANVRVWSIGGIEFQIQTWKATQRIQIKRIADDTKMFWVSEDLKGPSDHLFDYMEKQLSSVRGLSRRREFKPRVSSEHLFNLIEKRILDPDGSLIPCFLPSEKQWNMRFNDLRAFTRFCVALFRHNHEDDLGEGGYYHRAIISIPDAVSRYVYVRFDGIIDRLARAISHAVFVLKFPDIPSTISVPDEYTTRFDEILVSVTDNLKSVLKYWNIIPSLDKVKLFGVDWCKIMLLSMAAEGVDWRRARPTVYPGSGNSLWGWNTKRINEHKLSPDSLENDPLVYVYDSSGIGGTTRRRPWTSRPSYPYFRSSDESGDDIASKRVSDLESRFAPGFTTSLLLVASNTVWVRPGYLQESLEGLYTILRETGNATTNSRYLWSLMCWARVRPYRGDPWIGLETFIKYIPIGKVIREQTQRDDFPDYLDDLVRGFYENYTTFFENELYTLLDVSNPGSVEGDLSFDFPVSRLEGYADAERSYLSYLTTGNTEYRTLYNIAGDRGAELRAAIDLNVSKNDVEGSSVIYVPPSIDLNVFDNISRTAFDLIFRHTETVDGIYVNLPIDDHSFLFKERTLLAAYPSLPKVLSNIESGVLPGLPDEVRLQHFKMVNLEGVLPLPVSVHTNKSYYDKGVYRKRDLTRIDCSTGDDITPGLYTEKTCIVLILGSKRLFLIDMPSPYVSRYVNQEFMCTGHLRGLENVHHMNKVDEYFRATFRIKNTHYYYNLLNEFLKLMSHSVAGIKAYVGTVLIPSQSAPPRFRVKNVQITHIALGLTESVIAGKISPPGVRAMLDVTAYTKPL